VKKENIMKCGNGNEKDNMEVFLNPLAHFRKVLLI
jgi:hypothetical protein